MSHIEIDSKTIKALSAETRIKILKILNGNRKIAAEISKYLGLAPSTVNEHLKVMEGSGLVKKNDTGHKWIYYEITEKGKNMITPKMPISIILTLSLGIGLVLFGGINFFAANIIYVGSQSTAMQSATEKIAEVTEHAILPAATVSAINWLPLIMLAAGIILIAFGFIKLRRE